MRAFCRLFACKPLIGVIHLRPTPGSPRWDGDWRAVEEAARRDAKTLLEAGADGLIVENFGDAPFHRGPVEPVTVAAMAALTIAVADEVKREIPIGVNVLRNDALAALSVATVARADFIRVNVHTGAMATDQGVIEGRAAETMRERARFNSPVLIFADVWVKHATPVGFAPSLGDMAEEAYRRGLADALIVTGSGTGKPTSPDDLARVRRAVEDAPILVGSGVTENSVGGVLAKADGAIVGSALKRDGVAPHHVDQDRAGRLFRAVPKESRRHVH